MTFPQRPSRLHRANRRHRAAPQPLGPGRRHGDAPYARRPPGRRPQVPQLLRAFGVPLLLAAIVTASAPGWSTYRIQPGDTLSEIAQRYDTTVARLVRVNGLPGNGNLIYAGALLKVPSSDGDSSSGRSSGPVRHRVVIGDTLSGIAQKYGVSAHRIARRNHLPSSLIVRLGETLVIPGGQRRSGGSAASGDADKSDNTFAGRTYADSVVDAATENRRRLAARGQPSQEQVRDLITRTAQEQGVDPALALAVSWQESGWNMGVVSVANAIGAMQVIPSTGRWIASVIGRDLNLLDARDNVLAGVVLLRLLTRVASERNAVAGYYQGLASVRENGMYTDTRHYVANVLALKGRFG